MIDISEGDKTLLRQAVARFGVEPQTWMMIEEMGELSQALSKYRRKPTKANFENICEELADVLIVALQLIDATSPKEVQRVFNSKLAWLALRINEIEGEDDVLVRFDPESLKPGVFIYSNKPNVDPIIYSPSMVDDEGFIYVEGHGAVHITNFLIRK